MNEQDVGITSAPAAVVGAVIDLASAALGAQAPAVEIVDVEQVIEALRAWRPACVEFAYLDGLALIQQGNWADAEFVFRSLVHESRCMPASQDMLLRCMRALGRVDWAHEARRIADENPASDAARAARALLADEELQQAVRAARRTGVFVAPESAVALNEEKESEASATGGESPAIHAVDISLTMHYMRI
jgi:type III secretion protein HrpB1